MWQNALENGKLIISSILIAATLLVGSWEIITNVFMTRVEAEVQIKKLDLDTSYNKAFRLEQQIRTVKISPRPLTADQARCLKRLLKDLERVDDHIDHLEQKIYNDKD